jgi:hypothetical protein
MLVRIACPRCRLESLWTDDPDAFLSTVCRDPRRCHATLSNEPFRGGLSAITGADEDAQDPSRRVSAEA